MKLDEIAKHQRHHDLLEVRLEAQTPPLPPHGFATCAEALAALHAGEVTSTSASPSSTSSKEDSPELDTETVIALTEPALLEAPEEPLTAPSLPETAEAALTAPALPETAEAALTAPALPDTPEASVPPTSLADLTMLKVFAAPAEPEEEKKGKLKPTSPDNTGSTIECINLSGSPELGSPTSSASYVTIGTSSDEEGVKFAACYLTSP